MRIHRHPARGRGLWTSPENVPRYREDRRRPEVAYRRLAALYYAQTHGQRLPVAWPWWTAVAGREYGLTWRTAYDFFVVLTITPPAQLCWVMNHTEYTREEAGYWIPDALLGRLRDYPRYEARLVLVGGEEGRP